MLNQLKTQAKSRREYLSSLYQEIQNANIAFCGATIRTLQPEFPKSWQISVKKSQTCLKRFKDISSESNYLVNSASATDADALQATPLQTLPLDGTSDVLIESVSECGKYVIRVRKGEGEKEMWMETWTDQGLHQSMKMNEVCSKIYNDTCFGVVSWAKDSSKVVFVGEVPEPASYKNPWAETPKKEDEKKDDDKKKEEEKKDEEKKEEHFQTDKFLFQEEFGEQNLGKKTPGIFIFNIKDNKLERISTDGLTETMYPQYPIFDEHSNGLVFTAVDMPVKKFGIVYCLNRPAGLYYIKSPKAHKTPAALAKEKKDKEEKKEGEELKEEQQLEQTGPYLMRLSSTDHFMAMWPKFSPDFKHLAFFGNQKAFNSHTTCYQLFQMSWPLPAESTETPKSEMILDQVQTIEEGAEYGGLYGYQFTFAHAGYLNERMFLMMSEYKGCDRLYICDMVTKAVKMLHFRGVEGSYTLFTRRKNMMVVRYTKHNVPPHIYSVHVQDPSVEDLDQFVSSQNVKTCLLDSVSHEGEKKEWIGEMIKNVEYHKITLENGADAAFYVPSHVDKSKKLPMMVLIHGGPFSSSPLEWCLMTRQFMLAQGYCLLVTNYRGSIGYGQQLLESLLTNIGINDVYDCGELTKKALKDFSFIDEKRIGVFGGSHGGYLSGWLIGSPQYNYLFSAASLWNGVLNMNYMAAATDIPDWIVGCTEDVKQDFSLADNVQLIHERSPISHVKNVKTPSLFLVGDADLRVPPHQSYQFYQILKAMGVPARLMKYPGDNHSLMKCEHGVDANLNIAMWGDKYLIEPYEEDSVVASEI